MTSSEILLARAALAVTVVLGSAPFAAMVAAQGAEFDDEVVVTGVAPVGGTLINSKRLPFNVQSVDAKALAQAQSLDLAEHMLSHLGSVNINSAQNNPLQPDVQYRGYAASPLLGLSQGVAVYQSGVRINDTLGDAVSWDLLPESAVHSMSLIGGSNPLYGLNTLGGALAIEMKNGFNFQGHQAEIHGGSWDRLVTSVESGANNGTLGYYLNISYFEEQGWRDLSASDALNVFANLSYRMARSSLDLDVQFGDSELTGNGASPRGLLAIDRNAVFTAPDITENDLSVLTLNGEHAFSDQFKVSGMSFYRSIDTDSFNGDAADVLACQLGAGSFLIEGVEDDDLEVLGLDEARVCEENVLGVADPGELEEALNAGLAVGAEPFNIDNLELSGSGVIVDEAINNISRREQHSHGGDWNVGVLHDLFGLDSSLVMGFSYFRGQADFDAVTELARMDPLTRSTSGLGVGTFIDEEATSVGASTATWSVYFIDVLRVTDALTLTYGGRYNRTSVEVDDRSGRRPELNGMHEFSRFNPTVGFTYDIDAATNVYTSYSESSRAPTPIELSCNEGVFEVARAAAIARGDDPDDVDFECRLPNAFLADPPLDHVVARSVEVGVRGELGAATYRLGYYRTANNDDIIFQTTGRGTGLFGNVDETLRQGFESAFSISIGDFDYTIAYSHVLATFESDFLVLSPNHPAVNADGEVLVEKGDRMPGVPAQQFKFSGDFHLPWAIRAGIDVLYNSDQYLRGDEANALDQIAGYALVNLRASHAINRQLELFARVTNVFDAEYENFGLLGEDPGEVLPGLADTDSRFFGAGAPRGAWIGLRIRL